MHVCVCVKNLSRFSCRTALETLRSHSFLIGGICSVLQLAYGNESYYVTTQRRLENSALIMLQLPPVVKKENRTITCDS